jgi:ribosomal protein L37E
MLHLDYMENGSRMALDRDTNTLIPKFEADLEESVMVWCKKCGAPYLSIRDRCPYCGFTRQEEKIENELERAQKNVRRAKGLDEPTPLTVGDLSFVKKEQREHRVEEGQRRLDNQKRGLTVGDLSIRKGKDNRGLDQLYEGQRAYVEPQMSESQELIAEMQAEHRQKREESIKIKNLIIAQEEEKQIRKDAAAIRIRQEREQVDRELDQLLRKGKAHLG